jgi:hypothetical protein
MISANGKSNKKLNVIIIMNSKYKIEIKVYINILLNNFVSHEAS